MSLTRTSATARLVETAQDISTQHAAVRCLYEASFPPAEAEPWDEVWARVVEGEDRLYVAHGQDHVVGFLIDQPLGQARLVSWLAVDQHLRSRGAGGALLRAALHQARIDGLRWSLAEIEPPAGPVSEQFGDPARRLAFYARHGGREIVTGYGIPDNTEAGAVLDMTLLGFCLAHPDITCTCAPTHDQAHTYVSDLWGPQCYDAETSDPRRLQVMHRLARPTPAPIVA